MSDTCPTCAYCGRPIRAGTVCAEHRDLERSDPLRGQMRGPLPEFAGTTRPGWPETEADDDGHEDT